MADTELIAGLQLDSNSRTYHERRLVLKKVRGVRWVREKELHRGIFGSVWLEVGGSGEQRAVKEIEKKYLPADLAFQRELLAMAKLSKYAGMFVETQGWWDTPESLCIAMEYFPYGTLKDCLSEVGESDAKSILRQILQGLCYMHASEFVHRDLKPENVFVSSKAGNWKIKIGDFGLTKCIENSTNARTRVGTLLYQAPEILGWIDEDLDDYTEAVDIWSLGCLAYALLAHGPMSEKEVKHYSKRMRRLPTEALRSNKISNQGVSFIEALLVPEPLDRLSAHMALQHPWLSRANPWGHRELSIFSSKEDHEALQMLYVAGFGSDTKSLSGPEAFYWSVANEHDFITDFLLRNGVEINGMDSLNTRRTALHLAAKDGDCAAIHKLLNMRADINAEDRQGYQAIHVAVQHGHEEAVMLLIREMEVDPNVRARYSRKTLLHLAASAGHVTIVSNLLSDGANVNAQCSNKTTPLHCATLAGDTLVAEELIKKGAHIDKKDSMGMSPLRYAVNHNQRWMVGVLIDYGANIHLEDNVGVSPLTRAKDLGDRSIKKLLLAKKARLLKEAKDQKVKKKRQQQAIKKQPPTVHHSFNWLSSFQAKISKAEARGSSAKQHPLSAEKSLVQLTNSRKHEILTDRLGESEVEDADPIVYYLADAPSELELAPSQSTNPRLRGQADPSKFSIPRPRRRLRINDEAREGRVRALSSVTPRPTSQEVERYSGSREYGFGVGGVWSLLSPNPQIRFGLLKGNSGYVDRWSATPLPEPEGREAWARRPVGSLVDDLDAHGLRILMERQGRREAAAASNGAERLISAAGVDRERIKYNKWME